MGSTCVLRCDVLVKRKEEREKGEDILFPCEIS